ncbi:putative NAD(+) ADP-ribosyltransferase [Helianthus debilis subsp. tardiflorus]
MDYNEARKETVVEEKFNGKLDIQPRETKLEARVAKFISLICNVSLMKQQMMQIGYNAENLPLGKLSKVTILKVSYFNLNLNMKNTHAKTHTNYSVEIVQIFRTPRHGETDHFSKVLKIYSYILKSSFLE